MIDFTKPIFKRMDGCYIIYTEFGQMGIDTEHYPSLYAEVEVYLADHPEALVPEPVSEPPSKEEIERQRVAGIMTQLDALDRKSIRALRALVAGIPTAEDNAVLAELDAKAAELRAGL